MRPPALPHRLLWCVLAAACSGGPTTEDTGAATDSATPSDSGDATDSGDTGPTMCDDGLPAQPWVDAEDDPAMYALAADITLETRNGDWVLSEQWTGCDSYLFIQEKPRQATGYDKEIWERDHDDLMELLPANVHLFFMAESRQQDERDAVLDELQDDLEDELDDMDDATAEWWRERLHYVTTRDEKQDGWLGANMEDPAWGVAIDRFQRIRYIGSYADYNRYDESIGWFAPNLGMVANEPIYYNFEAQRQAELDADGATVLTVFDGDQGGDTTVEVTLPDADVLAAADTLTMDMTMECIGEGEFGTCPAWDYMAYAYMCDQADSDENPYADTACEAGETQEGTCTSPLGEARTGTYTCNEDGTGYDDLVCSSCDVEIARWITTYHREGRWVYDISPMLPLFADGGTRRIRFQSSNSYDLFASLRFSNSGKDARPSQVTYLMADSTEDTFEIPSTATKVELATVISQHGQTCGEFCNAEHHFVINDDADNEIMRDFPTAGTAQECMDQVDQGTVPNQYGTWWYGRAGWCPGREVPTVTHDITELVNIGGDNTIVYTTEGDAGTVRRRFWVVVSE